MHRAYCIYASVAIWKSTIENGGSNIFMAENSIILIK